MKRQMQVCLVRILRLGIRRVKGVNKHGVRCGNWLTAEQGKKLLQVFDRECLRGKRDYAMVAVLLGCDLRRAELALSLCMTCNNGKSIGFSPT